MAGKKHTVKQGDCIASIAFKYGFFPDSIWNDPDNRELKDEREDPNVLLPGDAVYIREKEEKEESCAAEKRHRFKRKGVPEKLMVQFKRAGEPRADADYTLDIDGTLSEGKTDGDGKVEVAIPPNARKGKITFREEGDEYELELGELDPVSEISGVQGRLRNLGFFAGDPDGQVSPALEGAIRAFQETQDLEVTGDPDDKTRKKLEEVYGG